MTTHSPTAVYFDAVQRAERVMHLLVHAVTYNEDSLTDKPPPTAVRTIEDVAHVVNAKAIQAKAQWNQNSRTALFTSAVVTMWAAQCVDRKRLTVTILGEPGVRHEDVVSLICSISDFRSFTMDSIETNTALSQLLLWLMTHDELYPVLHALTAEIDRRWERSMSNHDVRGLFILHMGLSLEYVADRMTIHENVPWEWQEPQLLQSYVELLHDTEHFHWCWSTMKIRHEM